MVAVADVGAEMVVKTLGPYGKTTIIDDGNFAYPTKDGWSILKRLRFNDPIYNTIYGVLKQVSFDIVNKVGDGTTTAFNGATIFIHKVLEYAKTHEFRQADFLKALNEVTELIVSELKASKYVKKIDVDGDFSDIYKIASISSNGNDKLAGIIQEIYQKTKNPNIYVALDASDKLSYEIQTGYKLDCNPIEQVDYRNSDDRTYVVNERAYIAIFDHNITYNEHNQLISALSRYASSKGRSVFIFAPHFDDIITNIITTNIKSMLNAGRIPNIMIIQVPMSMNIHRQYLSDIVLLTNAQVFDYGKVRAFNVLVHNQTASEEDKLKDALLDTDQYNFKEPIHVIDMCLGASNKLIIGEKYVLVQDYESLINEDVYKSTLDEVKKHFEEAKQRANKNTSMLQKEYMDAYQHYTKLFGNMGIIKVGGASELEKHCTKDAVDDAVLACRSAVDHGYIRGLNLATMNVILHIYHDLDMADEKRDIVNMFYEVFYEMALSVLRNKHSDNVKRDVDLITHPSPDVSITRPYLELTNHQIIDIAIGCEYGYDLLNETFMTDEECTVINSTRTDIEVLRGMVSILSTTLTSNQLLSINRSYDRSMSKMQQKQEKIKNQKEITSAVMDVIVEKLIECGVIGRLPVKIPLPSSISSPVHVPICEPTEYEPFDNDYSRKTSTKTGGYWGERQVTAVMETETCKIDE